MTKFLIPVVVLATFSASEARDLFEVEPNDTAFTAYDPGFLQHGDRLRGQMTGDPNFFDADYWWLRTAEQEPGIYENQLRQGTSVRVHEGAIMGMSYDNVVTPAQYADPSRAVDVYTRWYSFGRPSRINYEIAGRSIFTVNYALTYEQVRITPTDLGQFAPGMFRIQTLVSQSSSRVTMYGVDGNYEMIPELTKAGSVGHININTELAPGTYTFAIGFGPISGSQTDEQNRHFPPVRVLGENAIVNGGIPNFDDFQAPLVNFSAGSLTQTLDWRSEVRSRGTHSLAYYQFEVVPEGDGAIALAVGIGALAMTRRRSS